MHNIDWRRIKTEYITDDSTSYRSLAKKYGVTPNAVYNRSKNEGWRELRERHFDSVVTKNIEIAAEMETERLSRIITVSDKLLTRVEKLLEDEKTQLPPSQLESIAKVLKAIRDIQNGDREDGGTHINVVFGDGTEDFAV